MAEDIWQNIPYQIKENSVFKRGWPELPEYWSNSEIKTNISNLRKLRVEVNRAIEECRNQQKIGAALETNVRFIPNNQQLNDSLLWLEKYGNKEVDLFNEWLIVSEFKIVENLLEKSLHVEESELGRIQILNAKGFKCDRCWHYQKDVQESVHETKLCLRCANIINSDKLS